MTSPRLQIGRVSEHAHVYSITTVTHGRVAVFRDPVTAQVIADTFRYVDGTGRTCSLAWVVMPDHVHWLFQLRGGTLAGSMQLFKSRSSRRVNAAGQRKGPLWQPGYYDHAVRHDESLRKHAMYIAGNPVRAGLAGRLGEYPFAWGFWPWDG